MMGGVRKEDDVRAKRPCSGEADSRGRESCTSGIRHAIDATGHNGWFCYSDQELAFTFMALVQPLLPWQSPSLILTLT